MSNVLEKIINQKKIDLLATLKKNILIIFLMNANKTKRIIYKF